MLTPFKNATTPIQENYNLIDAKEHCFGQLKRRFPMLHYTFPLKTENIPKHIFRSFVLHNVAKHMQDPYKDFEQLEMEVQHSNERIPDGNKAQFRNRGAQRWNEIT